MLVPFLKIFCAEKPEMHSQTPGKSPNVPLSFPKSQFPKDRQTENTTKNEKLVCSPNRIPDQKHPNP